ncbi:hypothetical protein JWG45_00570 [Leptospira sp. 201903070]|uniref:Uncharacterized protein n=1 Tax=Leptospira ainlahdjerensis TaxID=2810033 RepID=A0ABS2U7W7_9LEPT|nr:hypothetical protein [Leptospira ainlahdjerensis]MBM9575633.1 hypothetical protein [Leptospira ainlahdjerensis]
MKKKIPCRFIKNVHRPHSAEKFHRTIPFKKMFFQNSVPPFNERDNLTHKLPGSDENLLELRQSTVKVALPAQILGGGVGGGKNHDGHSYITKY